MRLHYFMKFVCIVLFLVILNVDANEESSDKELVKENADECKCENGFCEKDEKGKSVCKCFKEWGSLTSTYCKKCNCGKGSNCTFTGFWGTKTCLCKNGYEENDGSCEGTCKGNPCLNGGTCKVVKKDIKCDCKDGFTGELCDINETSDPCAKVACKNNGTCKVVEGKAKCDCKEGFTGNLCEIDLCNPNPCEHDGKCNVAKGKVACVCKDPYAGPNCTIDLCNPNPCLNDGKCSATKGKVACVCKDRYTGANCTIDLCNPNPCLHDGKCSATKGKVACVCKDPYTGPNCTVDLCNPNPCLHDGKCSATKGKVACVCKDPYTGPNCTVDLCNPNPCLHDGKCSATKGKVVCVCKDPYTGPNCTVDLCNPNPCENGGKCNVAKGKVACVCKDPYIGPNCTINLCKPNPCQNNGECEVNKGKVTCKCKDHYTGPNCTEEACNCKNGFCEKNEKGELVCACPKEFGLYSTTECRKCDCGKDSNCTYSGFILVDKTCVCKVGYGDKDGVCKGTCEGNPCLNGGTCEVEKDDIKCVCKDGFSGDLCEKKGTKDPCAKIKCKNNGTCKVKKGKAKCYCKEGFIGDLCEIDLCNPNPCKNDGECKASNGKATCVCKDPFIGPNCTINLCKPNPCQNNGECKASNGKATCACKDPFIGPNCTINLCKPNPCKNNGECKASNGKATCVCKDPFTGTNCTINRCNPNPCRNNGTCNVTNGIVTCTCKHPFTGPNCTDLISTTESSSVTTTTVSSTGPSSPNSTIDDTTTSPMSSTRSTTLDSNSTISEGTTSPSSNTTTSLVTTTSAGNETEANSTTSITTTISANSTLSTASSSSVSSTVSTETYVTPTEVTPTGDGKCKSNPCKNGGTCQEDGHGVKCLCPYPYGGLICTDSYWCTEGLGKTLCEEGKCTFDFKTRIGRCSCQKGEYYDYNKKECKKIDKCPLTPNKCKGTNEICKENECRCISNFKRNEKKECVPNFCESSENVCGPTLTCIENPADPENVKCVCKENEVFDGTKCLEVNKCHVPPFLGCQQICNATSQTCDCYNGYTLQKDQKSCQAKEAASNCSIDCKPGTCYKDGETESCRCPPTHIYEDKACKVADLCKTSKTAQDLCPENACEPHPTLGFRCKCEGLLTYDKNNITCRRKLMCSEGGGHEICSKKSAKCVDDSNTKAGFRCDCAQKDEMDADGICKSKCDLKKNQDKCMERGAVCEMDGFEAICKCPPLFTFSKDGSCKELAAASYTGSIPFEKNKYSRKSLFAPGKATAGPDYDKMKQDLRDSMRLLYGSNYKFADILSCSNSTLSLSCTVELQFQTEPKDQVKLIGDCIDDGSGSCFIPPQLVLSKKSVKPDLLVQTNPCEDMFKIPNCGGIQTVCKRLAKDDSNFQCTCNKGFSSYGIAYPVTDRRTVVHKCQDINECLAPVACPNSTQCKNTYGSYECWCIDGYRLLNAKDDPKVTGCAPVCSNIKCGNGKCKASGSSYTCECKEGYTGTSCEKKINLAEYPKGMEVALITLSTIVIPLVLFSAYMIHKYRIINKKLNTSGYLDDTGSTLSMQPLRPGR